MRYIILALLCAAGACLYLAAYSPVMAGGIVTSLYDIALANVGQVAALYVAVALILILMVILAAFMLAAENAGLHRKNRRLEGRIEHLEDENDSYRIDGADKTRKFAALEGEVAGLHKVLDLGQLRPSNSNALVPVEHRTAAE